MKRVLGWVWFFSWCLGLPLLGWWIAGRIVESPPIVAPFLFASPLYAFTVVGSGWALRKFAALRRFRRAMDGHEGSGDPEVDGISGRYPDVFKRFENKIMLAPLADLDIERITILDGWVWIDSKFWQSLSRGGREFGLVRSALDMKSAHPASPSRYLTGPGVFLAAYVLASINLWLIIPCHILSLAGMVWAGQRAGERRDRERDEATLVLTRDVKGALQYIQATAIRGTTRTASLKAFAKANGIA